jgi:hypothetical protein
MPAGTLSRPLIIEAGATFRAALVITQRVNRQKVPVDLTGYTARMQIRSNVTASAVLMELTVGNGRIIIDGPEGIIRLYVSHTDTTAITWKAGVFDLELVEPGGDVVRLIQGTIRCSPEVTR